MITINLLPLHFRAKDRMPLGAFAALLLGVAVLCSTAGYYFYVQFGALAMVQGEREQLDEMLAGYQPRLKYHEALSKEKDESEKREAKIKEIGASRVLWTRKFDQLADIVNAGEDTGRYMIWFDSVETDQVVDSKGTSGGKFKVKGLSGSANFANLANFFNDVETTEFYRDFVSINNPAGKQTDPVKDLIPAQAWEFDMNLALKPPPDAVKKKTPPKPKGAPGAAPGKAPEAPAKAGDK